jgi:hypothetical protein
MVADMPRIFRYWLAVILAVTVMIAQLPLPDTAMSVTASGAAIGAADMDGCEGCTAKITDPGVVCQAQACAIAAILPTSELAARPLLLQILPVKSPRLVGRSEEPPVAPA